MSVLTVMIVELLAELHLRHKYGLLQRCVKGVHNDSTCAVIHAVLGADAAVRFISHCNHRQLRS